MSDLKRRLTAATSAAFAKAELPADLGRVTVSDRPDLADFQCNGALAAAKAARANPRALAEAVAAVLKQDPDFASVEIAGPGFINLVLTDAVLTERAREIAADPRLGAETVETPRRVIVDYGGPNVAKPMHVAICAPPSSARASSACSASAATRCGATPISATGVSRWAC